MEFTLPPPPVPNSILGRSLSLLGPEDKVMPSAAFATQVEYAYQSFAITQTPLRAAGPMSLSQKIYPAMQYSASA